MKANLIREIANLLMVAEANNELAAVRHVIFSTLNAKTDISVFQRTVSRMPLLALVSPMPIRDWRYEPDPRDICRVRIVGERRRVNIIGGPRRRRNDWEE